MAAPTVVANKDGTFNVGNQKFSSQQGANKAVVARSQLKKYATTPIVSQGKTKQQYLDESVKAGNVSVDQSGNIISKAGTNIGNTSEFNGGDMTKVFDKTKGKYVEQTQAPTDGTEGVITPTPTDNTQTDQTQNQSQTGPQEATSQPGADQQGVVSGNVGGANFGESRQQFLDKKIASGEVTVDGGGNVISKSGQNLGNINGIDMTQSTIGQVQPNANADIQQQQANIQGNNQDDQDKINNIKPDVTLGLSNSPDSPFWNSFGQAGVDAENQLPGFLNERNKVIASGIMLNNPNIKYMAEAKRKEMILKDIIDRQEGGIDPNIEGRYSKTVDNINNLINREIPAYNSDDYFKMIVDGGKIDYKASVGNPELRSARLRFNNLQQYSSMDVNGLTQAIKEGKLNKGGQLRNDLLNKGMGASLEIAYSSYNMQTESAVTDYVQGEVGSFSTDKSLESQGSLKIDLGTGLDAQISEKIISLMTEDKIPTLASFLAADQDVQDAKKASKKTEEEINTLSDEITAFADSLKEKVVEQGGEATDDPFLDAYIQEKTKPFVKRLTQLNGKYRNEIAMLDDASENARTAFEVKEYNKQSEIQGYQFVLGRLDKQKQEATAAAATAQAQSNRDKSFALQQKQFDLSKAQTEANIAKIKSETETPTSSIVTPTGQITPVTFGGKKFSADSAMASVLPTLEEQLNAAGIKRTTGASNYRTKEQQQKLYDAYKNGSGIQAAAPGSSKHETGMAIDMYEEGTNASLAKPSAAMVKIMNDNGFFQTAGANDMGHFEYQGAKKAAGDISGLSSEAAAIVTGYGDLQDQTITGSKRLKLASEIGNYFDANKDKYDDQGEFYIRKSAIYNGKPGTVTTNKLESISNVGFQLDNLEKAFNNADTGPLRKVREKTSDHWTNQDYKVIRQQMEAILPDLARGVFGEKGVLTDSDIERYRQTIPNIGNKEAVNKAIVDNLRSILTNTFKSAIVTEAKNGNNMSNWIDSYIQTRDSSTTPIVNNSIVNNQATGSYQKTSTSPYSRRNP